MSLQPTLLPSAYPPALRYHVRALGEGFAVCDRRLDDRVVRFFRLASSADLFTTLGNLLGRCSDADCLRPAVVKRTRAETEECFCLEHFPDADLWGFVPVPALRLWREG